MIAFSTAFIARMMIGWIAAVAIAAVARRAHLLTRGGAVAAAVIGGTLLTGGSGTVVGALIGALFLGVLKDGLILQGVNANYLLFYTGLAIFVAMTANVYVGRVRRGHSGSG